MIDSGPSGLVRLLRIATRLKRTPRTGWLDRGVPRERVESVSDHTLHVALLAWLAAAGEPSLDRDRVLKLALIHDLAEAITGDQTPYHTADIPAGNDLPGRAGFLNQRHRRDEHRTVTKRAAESAAIADMTRDLPVPLRFELAGLWRELEERSTPEARFVKQADKLETYLQSLDYRADQPNLPVASFASEVAEVIDIPVLVALRDAITKSFDGNGESPVSGHPGERE